MLLKLNKYVYLVAAICFIVVAAVIENGLLKQHPETHLVNDFQKTLLKNEKFLNSQIIKIKTLLSADTSVNVGEIINESELTLNAPDFGYLIFKNGKLVYWSNRTFAFYNTTDEIEVSPGLVHLPNGYYLTDTATQNNIEVLGLHLIKNKYNFENKYLQNRFSESYNVPEVFTISETKNEADREFWITNSKNDYLFTLEPGGQFLCTKNQLYIPEFIYFLGLLILLFYFKKEFIESDSPFVLRVAILGTALFIIYWLHIIFNIPRLFIHIRIFSPNYFALNNWLPSLGDFFLISLFFLFWLYNFGHELNIKQLHRDSLLPRKIIVILLLLFSASLFLLVHFFIEQLILNSTISFALNKIVNITVQSAFGIFAISLLLISLIYFTARINEEALHDFSFLQLLGVTIAIALFIGLVQFVSVGAVSVAALLFFIVTSVLGCVLSRKYLHSFTLSYLIIFISVAAIYSLQVFYSTISQKEREVQKLLAITLETERDPAAEEFLIKIQAKLHDDPAIYSLLLQGTNLSEYIEKAYFSGYFSKYITKVYVCEPTDSLFLEPENRSVPCMPFMDGIIKSQGDRILGTDFYFMDNMNGRISYTGKLFYPFLPEKGGGVTIYIDLDSDLLFEGIGFPELLIDKSIARSENYKKFDYAKYYGGELTDKFGDYNYNFHIDAYLEHNKNAADENKEFIYKKWHGREHLIYHTRANNYVIVSRSLYTFNEYLISFPYLFVFYFLSALLILFIANPAIRNRKIVFDLKFKIQAAIISIVFVTLLGVALVTISYNVKQYRSKHENDLNEKMKSISKEIELRLEDKTEITPPLTDWLHRELGKLSNIFRTDINIYGADGELIASSRGEIFENGLISTRMNARAYNEIFQNFQAGYSETESIGNLSYLSAYKPIINNYSDYLGFINLPYFIKQDNYSQEITTFVVAFINLYVLLFLASIIAAVFIANQITRPLVIIQERLQKMQLGKQNEHIVYNRNDEIGRLIIEYNKKVDELAVSAELLARSERESAWREMAKQIAHEIKNPLTPMKLNIQHLQRAKAEGKEYEKYIERVTATLIEQIDNLSNIATEFSNFAKIPTARNQVFCLAEQLQRVINLYETHDRITIEYKSKKDCKLEVNADREQLSRAVINLIRNGIQAVPEDKKGKIEIWVEQKNGKAIIAVKDNGSGIPVELRDKLFTPSFTTKTSGMGLGLAIVKNIVENFSGKIWFETELNVGTTFFLEIPIYSQSS